MKKNDLKKFFEKLEINPKTEDLFHTALVHKSIINEANNNFESNERLEFLGDAVLELVTTEFLYLNYPSYPEGDLTSFRAALVKTESLAEEAKRLGIGKFIYMSNGEEATGGRERPYILANTLEAVIGALYLDQGYKACQTFIIKNICYKIEKIINKRLDIDSKSKLQELSQEVTKITPTYELVSASGPDHNKVFEMAVKIGDYIFATGKGKSKQEAEQDAATKALNNWDDLYKKFFND
ncbi:MAG: ribonuclease 3 [Candidatus Dojkabacteria bacterium]|nr:MAG: ribonuclease 3 [Candidatus Dojkabacteria bacterium]